MTGATSSDAAGLVRRQFEDLATFVAARRTFARARRLYEFGQGISAQGGAQALLRAARLHRRALRLLEPATPYRSFDRIQARDRVRQRLFEGSALGWLSRHFVPLLGALVMVGLIVVAVVALVPAVRYRLFPRDVALGTHWVASSAIPGYESEGTLDDKEPTKGFFHTANEPSPSVTVDLGRLRNVRAVRVANRSDCCQDRILPLAIELSDDQKRWSRVAYRRALFDTYTAHFAPRRARFVRVRVDQQSFLHLRLLSVYECQP